MLAHRHGMQAPEDTAVRTGVGVRGAEPGRPRPGCWQGGWPRSGSGRQCVLLVLLMQPQKQAIKAFLLLSGPDKINKLWEHENR